LGPAQEEVLGLTQEDKRMDAVRSLLDKFPADLAPLADAARGFLSQPGELSADGVLSLGHRPWVAPQNYAITLYPGVPADALTRYSERLGLQVPTLYATFLAATNGAFCFGMMLAGAPRPRPGPRSLLDRSALQCHDLGTAATLWADEYRKLPAGAFHFGSRHYSPRENVGYFIAGGRILSIRRSGRVVGEWGKLSEFLRDELPVSEALDVKRYPPRAVE
jgi:hypothetical protein